MIAFMLVANQFLKHEWQNQLGILPQTALFLSQNLPVNLSLVYQLCPHHHTRTEERATYEQWQRNLLYKIAP